MTTIICAECKRIVKPDEPEQRYCSRHCARIAQARRGLPSHDDKKALLLDAVAAKVDELFGERKK